MKALKVIMVVLIAVSFIIPLAVKESQAAAYYTCWVNKVGGGDTKWIQLTDATGTVPAIAGLWYSIPVDTNTTATISEALTAMASGLKVYVYLSGTAEGSTAYYLYLMDQ
jgi:hypothetical protein